MSRRGPALLHYRGPDGLTWTIEVRAPGTTNAMVVFQHPDRTLRADRYAWWVSDGPAARDVTSRIDPRVVLDGLAEAELRRLFLRSVPIENRIPRFEPG